MIKKRKGFTLVELIVTITIVAILAISAIIGYSSFNKEATLDADKAVISQLNIQLQENEQQELKAKYPYEAVKQAYEGGFVIENLEPQTNGYHYAYDTATNRFMLLDKKYNFVYGDEKHTDLTDAGQQHKVFVFVSSESELDNVAKDYDYSIYLASSFTFKSDNKTLKVDTGIDIGDIENIEKIEYDNASGTFAKEVIIHTNGNTEIVVNGYAPENKTGDIVNHYGESGKQIINVSSESFHEFGGSTFVELQAGHFVQEANSLVCFIDATASKNAVSIDILANAITGTIRNTNVDYPVTIRNEEGSLVVNLELHRSKGALTVDFEEKPLYANTYDTEGDEKNNSNNIININGIGDHGQMKQSCPATNRVCLNETTGEIEHDFVTLPNLDVKVCRRCGGYEYSKVTKSEKGAEEKETTTVNFNEYTNEDGETVRGDGEKTTRVEHSHAWSDWTILVEASCTSDGIRYRRCSTCGEVERNVYKKATGHHYINHICEYCGKQEDVNHKHIFVLDEFASKEATCTSNGLKVYVCTCGARQYKTIVSEGHKYVTDTNRTHDATCTETGILVEVCQVCNNERYSTIDVKGHNYVLNKELSSDPDCTHDGLLVHICENCGATTYTVNKAKDHKWNAQDICEICGIHKNHTHVWSNEKEVKATCTSDGYKKQVCTCKAVQYIVTKALGHHFVKDEANSISPSCSRQGILVEKCDHEGCTQRRYKVLDAKGHKYVDGVCEICGENDPAIHHHDYKIIARVEADCENDGLITYECSCNSRYYIVLNATGHKWVNDECSVCHIKKSAVCEHTYKFNESKSVAPSCLTEGVEAMTCTKCDITKYYKLNPLGHHYVNGVCTRCGDLEDVPHTHNHQLSTELSIAAKCESDGLNVYICSCGDIKTEVVGALGHDWDENDICKRCGTEKEKPHTHNYVLDEELSITATCTTAGLTVKKCSCGDIIAEEIKKLGHDWKVVGEVKATCEEGGHIDKECQRQGCGATMSIPTSPLNHDWSDWESTDDNHSRYCKNDNTHVQTGEHEFANGSNKCKVCGYVRVFQITNGTTILYRRSIEDALAAVTAGGKITVLADISISGGVTVQADKDFTFDINNHIIDLGKNGYFYVYGKMIIDDLSSDGNGSITGYGKSSTTPAMIYSVFNDSYKELSSTRDCNVLFYLNTDAVVTIKGGTFNIGDVGFEGGTVYVPEYSYATFNIGNSAAGVTYTKLFSKYSQNTELKGGRYYGHYVSSYYKVKDSWIADGYKLSAGDENGYRTIVKKDASDNKKSIAVDYQGVTIYYETIEEAIFNAHNGSTIRLTEDYLQPIDLVFPADRSFIFNLDGYVLSLAENTNIQINGIVAINDLSDAETGKIIGQGKDDKTFFVVGKNGDLTIEGNEIIIQGEDVVAITSEGNVTLNGGQIRADIAFQGKGILVPSGSAVRIYTTTIFKDGKNTGNELQGGRYQVDPNKYVVEPYTVKWDTEYNMYQIIIGDTTHKGVLVIEGLGTNKNYKYFDDLYQAIDYANTLRNYPTVVLLSDQTAHNISVARKMTINLNGYTLTCDGEGQDSDDFMFMITHLSSNNSLGTVIENGTIDANYNALLKLVVGPQQKAEKATLRNVKLLHSSNNTFSEEFIVEKSVSRAYSSPSGRVMVEFEFVVGDYEYLDEDNVIEHIRAFGAEFSITIGHFNISKTIGNRGVFSYRVDRNTNAKYEIGEGTYGFDPQSFIKEFQANQAYMQNYGFAIQVGQYIVYRQGITTNSYTYVVTRDFKATEGQFTFDPQGYLGVSNYVKQTYSAYYNNTIKVGDYIIHKEENIYTVTKEYTVGVGTYNFNPLPYMNNNSHASFVLFTNEKSVTVKTDDYYVNRHMNGDVEEYTVTKEQQWNTGVYTYKPCVCSFPTNCKKVVKYDKYYVAEETIKNGNSGETLTIYRVSDSYSVSSGDKLVFDPQTNVLSSSNIPYGANDTLPMIKVGNYIIERKEEGGSYVYVVTEASKVNLGVGKYSFDPRTNLGQSASADYFDSVTVDGQTKSVAVCSIKFGKYYVLRKTENGVYTYNVTANPTTIVDGGYNYDPKQYISGYNNEKFATEINSGLTDYKPFVIVNNKVVGTDGSRYYVGNPNNFTYGEGKYVFDPQRYIVGYTSQQIYTIDGEYVINLIGNFLVYKTNDYTYVIQGVTSKCAEVGKNYSFPLYDYVKCDVDLDTNKDKIRDKMKAKFDAAGDNEVIILDEYVEFLGIEGKHVKYFVFKKTIGGIAVYKLREYGTTITEGTVNTDPQQWVPGYTSTQDYSKNNGTVISGDYIIVKGSSKYEVYKVGTYFGLGEGTYTSDPQLYIKGTTGTKLAYPTDGVHAIVVGDYIITKASDTSYTVTLATKYAFSSGKYNFDPQGYIIPGSKLVYGANGTIKVIWLQAKGIFIWRTGDSEANYQYVTTTVFDIKADRTYAFDPFYARTGTYTAYGAGDTTPILYNSNLGMFSEKISENKYHTSTTVTIEAGKKYSFDPQLCLSSSQTYGANGTKNIIKVGNLYITKNDSIYSVSSTVTLAEGKYPFNPSTINFSSYSDSHIVGKTTVSSVTYYVAKDGDLYTVTKTAPSITNGRYMYDPLGKNYTANSTAPIILHTNGKFVTKVADNNYAVTDSVTISAGNKYSFDPQKQISSSSNQTYGTVGSTLSVIRVNSLYVRKLNDGYEVLSSYSVTAGNSYKFDPQTNILSTSKQGYGNDEEATIMVGSLYVTYTKSTDLYKVSTTMKPTVGKTYLFNPFNGTDYMDETNCVAKVTVESNTYYVHKFDEDNVTKYAITGSDNEYYHNTDIVFLYNPLSSNNYGAGGSVAPIQRDSSGWYVTKNGSKYTYSSTVTIEAGKTYLFDPQLVLGTSNPYNQAGVNASNIVYNSAKNFYIKNNGDNTYTVSNTITVTASADGVIYPFNPVTAGNLSVSGSNFVDTLGDATISSMTVLAGGKYIYKENANKYIVTTGFVKRLGVCGFDPQAQLVSGSNQTYNADYHNLIKVGDYIIWSSGNSLYNVVDKAAVFIDYTGNFTFDPQLNIVNHGSEQSYATDVANEYAMIKVNDTYYVKKNSNTSYTVGKLSDLTVNTGMITAFNPSSYMYINTTLDSYEKEGRNDIANKLNSMTQDNVVVEINGSYAIVSSKKTKYFIYRKNVNGTTIYKIKAHGSTVSEGTCNFDPKAYLPTSASSGTYTNNVLSSGNNIVVYDGTYYNVYSKGHACLGEGTYTFDPQLYLVEGNNTAVSYPTSNAAAIFVGNYIVVKEGSNYVVANKYNYNYVGKTYNFDPQVYIKGSGSTASSYPTCNVLVLTKNSANVFITKNGSTYTVSDKNSFKLVSGTTYNFNVLEKVGRSQTFGANGATALVVYDSTSKMYVTKNSDTSYYVSSSLTLVNGKSYSFNPMSPTDASYGYVTGFVQVAQSGNWYITKNGNGTYSVSSSKPTIVLGNYTFNPTSTTIAVNETITTTVNSKTAYVVRVSDNEYQVFDTLKDDVAYLFNPYQDKLSFDNNIPTEIKQYDSRYVYKYTENDKTYYKKSTTLNKTLIGTYYFDPIGGNYGANGTQNIVYANNIYYTKNGDGATATYTTSTTISVAVNTKYAFDIRGLISVSGNMTNNNSGWLYLKSGSNLVLKDSSKEVYYYITTTTKGLPNGTYNFDPADFISGSKSNDYGLNSNIMIIVGDKFVKKVNSSSYIVMDKSRENLTQSDRCRFNPKDYGLCSKSSWGLDGIYKYFYVNKW